MSKRKKKSVVRATRQLPGPDYFLRNIPRQDWKAFATYCNNRGWDMRFVLLAFIREAPAKDLGTGLVAANLEVVEAEF